MCLHTYFAILILVGVYRSRGVLAESLGGLWEKFIELWCLWRALVFSRLIRFDDRESRPVRRQGQSALFVTSWWNSFPIFVTRDILESYKSEDHTRVNVNFCVWRQQQICKLVLQIYILWSYLPYYQKLIARNCQLKSFKCKLITDWINLQRTKVSLKTVPYYEWSHTRPPPPSSRQSFQIQQVAK